MRSVALWAYTLISGAIAGQLLTTISWATSTFSHTIWGGGLMTAAATAAAALHLSSVAWLTRQQAHPHVKLSTYKTLVTIINVTAAGALVGLLSGTLRDATWEVGVGLAVLSLATYAGLRARTSHSGETLAHLPRALAWRITGAVGLTLGGLAFASGIGPQNMALGTVAALTVQAVAHLVAVRAKTSGTRKAAPPRSTTARPSG